MPDPPYRWVCDPSRHRFVETFTAPTFTSLSNDLPIISVWVGGGGGQGVRGWSGSGGRGLTWRQNSRIVLAHGSLVFVTQCNCYQPLRAVYHPITVPPRLPTKVYINARTQVWKTRLFCIIGTTKHQFFNWNRWFWGPMKQPFWSKTHFFLYMR